VKTKWVSAPGSILRSTRNASVTVQLNGRARGEDEMGVRAMLNPAMLRLVLTPREITGPRVLGPHFPRSGSYRAMRNAGSLCQSV
jgi:hypothetical protein